MMRLLLAVFCLISIELMGQSYEQKIPKRIQKSIPDLTETLTQNLSNEEEIATSIHLWITNNIEYDYKKLESKKCFKHRPSKDILKSKKAICTGYAQLYQSMLDAAGIESEIVTGYIRPGAVNDTTHVISDTHAWLAVKINGTWKMTDPTWDAGYVGRIPIESKSQKEDEPQRYKNKIGFVQKPGTDWFLVERDTFLLHHLPTVPFWQLRNDPLTIEEFLLSEDSLKDRMSKVYDLEFDYKQELNEYLNKDFLDQLISIGDQGYEFNRLNARLKALQYYNYLSILNNRKVRQQYDDLPEIQLEELYAKMASVNDTMIVYSKAFNEVHKNAFKARKTQQSAWNKVEKSATKTSEKFADKGLKWHTKALSTIEKADIRMEGENQKMNQSFSKIVATYQNIENKTVGDYELDLLPVQNWVDSITQEVAIFEALIDEWRNTQENPTLVSIDYYQNYAISAMSYNNEIKNQATSVYNETIAKVDSISHYCFNKLDSLYTDSLTVDILSKTAFAQIRKIQKHVRSSRESIRSLGDNGTIDNPFKYEAYFNRILLDYFETMYQINIDAKGYNDWMSDNMRSTRNKWYSLARLAEAQIRANEKKNLHLLNQIETDHERDLNLYSLMKQDGKVWKKLFKEKLKE